jgi:hypothetical protein
VLGLSHKVRNFDKLEILLLDGQGKQVDTELIVKPFGRSKKDISNTWSIKLAQKTIESHHILSLSVKSQTCS